MLAPRLDDLGCGPPLQPPGNEVTVRLFDEDRCRPRLHELLAVLSDDERRQPGPPERRRRRGLGRALLRLTLSAVAADGTRPSDWRFATDPWDRPRIVSPAPDRLRFSISYGDAAVAVAVSPEREVGVDIEPLIPRGSTTIPWSELAPGEQEELRSTDADMRYHRFLHMWTLKEAYAKWLGMGAHLDFPAIVTTVEPPTAGLAGGGHRLALHQELVDIGGRRHLLAVS